MNRLGIEDRLAARPHVREMRALAAYCETLGKRAREMLPVAPSYAAGVNPPPCARLCSPRCKKVGQETKKALKPPGEYAIIFLFPFWGKRRNGFFRP